ncbi:hypothetical protein CIK05_08880 [Bdellovibrio sp. qaytius]|nr:hypothetical protein CIK05_08880 [Bdellovibrio sp. qaytius]
MKENEKNQNTNQRQQGDMNQQSGQKPNVDRSSGANQTSRDSQHDRGQSDRQQNQNRTNK